MSTDLVHVPGRGKSGNTNPVGRPNAARRIAIAQRRRDVAERTLAKQTQHEIAAELGIAQQTVADDVAAIKRQWAQENAADYDATIAEERATLDMAQRGVVARGAFDGEHEAVGDLLKITDQRAQLLGLRLLDRARVGLDARALEIEEQKVALLTRALEAAMAELDLDPNVWRPVVGRHLRALESA